MIQRFIRLGEGYSDVYELVELGKTNKHRLHHLFRFDTVINEKPVTSLVIILKPVEPGNFMPLYICLEGIPQPEYKKNGRYQLFEDFAKEVDKPIIPIVVKPSSIFQEKELYYQYILGLLRMNNFIPPIKF